MTHPGDLLSAYLDGELEASEARSIVQHLGFCEPCRLELSEVQRSRSAVRGLPMLDLPDEALAAVEGDIEPAGRHHRILVGAAAALVAVLVAAAAVLSADTPVPISASDLSDRYAARSAADPGFNPVKLLPPVGGQE